MIIQRSQISIFEWSKRPKKRFLAIFWSLVCCIDLILPKFEQVNKSISWISWISWISNKLNKLEPKMRFSPIMSSVVGIWFGWVRVQNVSLFSRCNGLMQDDIVWLLLPVTWWKCLTLSQWPSGHVAVLNFSWGQPSICYSVCPSVC